MPVTHTFSAIKRTLFNVLSRVYILIQLHFSRTVPWAEASPHLQEHAADLCQVALALFGQPDPRTAGINPTAYLTLIIKQRVINMFSYRFRPLTNL
jgi:hypothetical protein